MRNEVFLQKLLVSLIIIFLFFFSSTYVNASTNQQVSIYFFHSNTCSHCQSEEKLLKLIEKNYSNVKVYRYEVHQEENATILEQVKKIYKISGSGVPITVIGNQLYTGYSEEKSPLKFIKTIEYYSRYGYHDQVGEMVNPDYFSSYYEEENTIKLNSFIESYKNYSLIGNIKTDDLEPSIVAILLGFFSEINIVSILSIIIVLVLLQKIGGQKNKMLLLAFYFMTSLLFQTNYVVSNNLFTFILEICFLILFMINLLKYTKNKKRQYVVGNIFIILAILSNYLEFSFFGKNISIFKEVLSLRLLEGMDMLLYYANYFTSAIIIDFVLISVIHIIVRKHVFSS